jgi:hypothetical protein
MTEKSPPVDRADASAAGGDPSSDLINDPIASRAALENQYAADLANHRRDARDPKWAPRAESGIRDTIGTVAGTHKATRVECKTTSCVATMEWPSYDEALHGYGRLLTAIYTPNCAVKILVHDPVDGQQTYQEQLLFDCTNARASQ